MTQWQKVKVGDFLTQRKERIVIDSNIEYSLVTISNKGVIKLREKKKGAVISAKTGYIAKTGDFIYSRLSVHTGAFGIVPIELNNALITNEMPCFEINKSKIFPTILIKMIGLPNFIWQLNQLTQGVGRVRIKESMMLSLSLMLPSIKEQKIIVKKLKDIETEESDLKQEITQQQILLKKLRQQILQEAIEGKLTQDWRVKNPNTEPASELLKRIQAEKQQLIKDKKIKAQKPLSVITEDEKLFKLPKSWVWCQVNDIANIGTGATPLTSEPSYYGGEFNWMTSGDTGYDYVTHTKLTISKKAIQETNCKIYPTKTLVVAMYGQGKTRGQVTELKIDTATNQACVAIQIYIFSVEANQFLKTHFKKIYNEIRKLAQGGAQPNLNMGKIKANVVALPPLPEQKAIVTKVEKLLSICDKLQTQITANQTHAEQLMQAVLKEAFTQSEQPIKLTV
jgi:type I restriction enzyme S subunit